MGAPNVHPYWTPGEHSIVRTDEFSGTQVDFPRSYWKGPKAVAEYLTKMCEDDEEYEKFFEWKKGPSRHFKQRFNDCAFYGAECRLCKYIAEQVFILLVRKELIRVEK